MRTNRLIYCVDGESLVVIAGGKISGSQAPALQPEQTVVRIDSRYSRPAEVDTLLGNAAKAQRKLG